MSLLLNMAGFDLNKIHKPVIEFFFEAQFFTLITKIFQGDGIKIITE